MSDLVSMNNVQEKLREKIKAAMLDLVPPDVIDKFIESEWKRLTTDTWDRDVFKPCDLRIMLGFEMRKLLQDRVAEIAKLWAKSPGADSTAHDLLERLTKLASAGFLQNVATSIVDTAIRSAADVLEIKHCQCGRVISSPKGTGGKYCSCGCWVN